MDAVADEPTAIALYMRDLRLHPVLPHDEQAAAFLHLEQLDIAVWGLLLGCAEETILCCAAPEVADTIVRAVSRRSPARLRAIDKDRLLLRDVLSTRSVWPDEVVRALVAADFQRAKLVKANLRLVIGAAARYARGQHGLCLDDLIQEGNVGLMKAVDRYDPHRGHTFATYAMWWIRHALNRAISDRAPLVRIPVHVLERRRLVARAAEDLWKTLQRPPTREELIAACGPIVPAAPAPIIHMDAPSGDGDRSIGETIADLRVSDPDDDLHTEGLHALVQETIAAKLTPMEADILRARFHDGRTLVDVGKDYRLTRERIRQIEAKALGKLRRALQLKGVSDG